MDLAAESQSLCDALTEGQDVIARELMDQMIGKWSVWVIHVLAAAPEPMRFSRLHEQVEGISQKVLTQTLRQLERNGLVSRTVFPQVPPRVEYALTPLGRDLLGQLLPLWRWVTGNIGRFERARGAFDAAKTP